MKRETFKCKEEQAYIIEELENKSFSHPWTKYNIQDDMMHDFSQFRVLQVDGENVGYVNIWIINDAIELNRICVLPEHRRSGHAEYMMEELIDLCKKHELERIILEVAADNNAAIALYDKFDFKDVHVREKYYDNKVDALIKVRMTDEH